MIEIDAQEAEAQFGPCWEDVLKVIRQAESPTPAQLARATAAVAVLDAATLNAAWDAARIAAFATGRTAAVNAAFAAAKSASWNAADAAAWIVAALDAAVAAVVSDLVEKHGLTAKHIADLTQAWRVIIGAS